MCCICIVRPRPSSALAQAGMHMVFVKRCETVIEIAQITSGCCTWPVALGGMGESIPVLAYCVVCWGGGALMGSGLTEEMSASEFKSLL